MSAEIKVDKASGWIKEANIKHNLEGEMSFKTHSNLPETVIVPMIEELNMTVKGE